MATEAVRQSGWVLSAGARHHDATAIVAASPEALFAYIDDHSRLSSHMMKSSWMMGGARMRTELDDAKGQAVGSHIRLSGKVLGFRLLLDEVVTRREPPTEKTWETVGVPRLLVVGSYRMGFRISSDGTQSRLNVFIDYELPVGRTRWLGQLFGSFYARWCVKQMLDGTARHFNLAADRGPRSV